MDCLCLPRELRCGYLAEVTPLPVAQDHIQVRGPASFIEWLKQATHPRRVRAVAEWHARHPDRIRPTMTAADLREALDPDGYWWDLEEREAQAKTAREREDRQRLEEIVRTATTPFVIRAALGLLGRTG